MNKNYYENLKQDYNTIKQLFEITDAERDGVIPKIAGPVLCYVSKDALKSKPKDDAVFRKLRGRYSYIHYPGGETLRNNWTIEELKKYIENGHSIQIGPFQRLCANMRWKGLFPFSLNTLKAIIFVYLRTINSVIF